MPETQAEFKDRITRSTNGRVRFGETHVALPCHCDCLDHPHWVAIRNDPESLAEHAELEQWRMEDAAAP